MASRKKPDVNDLIQRLGALHMRHGNAGPSGARPPRNSDEFWESYVNIPKNNSLEKLNKSASLPGKTRGTKRKASFDIEHSNTTTMNLNNLLKNRLRIKKYPSNNSHLDLSNLEEVVRNIVKERNVDNYNYSNVEEIVREIIKERQR